MDEENKGFVVKHRGPSRARADFACLAKACETKRGATVYELPANATHCPLGHKRLRRIFSAPNISRGIAKRSDAFVGPEYTRQKQAKDKAKEQQHVAPMLAVPNDGNIASAVSRALGMPMAGSLGQPGKAKPTPSITVPDLAGVKGAGMAYGPRPDPSSKRWKPSPDEIAAARRGA